MLEEQRASKAYSDEVVYGVKMEEKEGSRQCRSDLVGLTKAGSQMDLATTTRLGF